MSADDATSTRTSHVSYLQVYKNWIRKDKFQNGDFTIPVCHILQELTLNKLLTKSESQDVYYEKNDAEKLRALFHDIMPAKGGEGFNQVIEILCQNNNTEIATDLIDHMEQCLSLNASFKTQNPLMADAQEQLSQFIIVNVDFIAEFWCGRIHLPTTSEAFVDVQVLDDYRDDRGEAVHKYEEVFDPVSDKPVRRILIQGDPGCGKSTYVNKIALDWANKHEYLRNMFDLVFFICLQKLTMSIEQTIRALLPMRSTEYVEEYYKHHSSKVLLILDGFDEFPEDSEFYDEVQNVLNGRMVQFSFFTIIVTTRRSHVDKVPQRVHERSLLIKGFDEQSTKLFLQRQNVPVPNGQADSNLLVLLQNPLFCAIYCSLYFGGVDQSKLEDPYDFIKALVERPSAEQNVEQREEQLMLLGMFSFQQMLGSETLNIVETLFPTKIISCPLFGFVKKKTPRRTLQIGIGQIQLGLLIMRRIPNVGLDYEDEFSFPHQLIAEYLAARYFVRSLTEKQLKQLNPEKLVVGKYSYFLLNLILSSPSSLPFLRFLLFEFLNLRLQEKESSKKLILKFLSEEFRFSCYCKSGGSAPTIADISSLDIRKLDDEVINDGRFFPTLAKCAYLKSLDFSRYRLSINDTAQLVLLLQESSFPKLIKLKFITNVYAGSLPELFTALAKCKYLEQLEMTNCNLSTKSLEQLASCVRNDCWQNLNKLNLGWNSNVGTTVGLFSALAQCKRLEVVILSKCNLSIESVREMAACIDKNCWPNLATLDLMENENVGISNELFGVLYKCRNLQELDLFLCSMTQQSMNTFLSTFNANSFQRFKGINLSWNCELEIDDCFYTAFLNCSRISYIYLYNVLHCSLGLSGEQARTIIQSTCDIII